MRPHNQAKVLWDIDDAPSGFSDSSVIRLGKGRGLYRCVKLYRNLAEDVIKEYHDIHRRLSETEVIIHLGGTFMGSQKFDKISINVLDLGSRISAFRCTYLGNTIVSAEVPYIEGRDVFLKWGEDYIPTVFLDNGFMLGDLVGLLEEQGLSLKHDFQDKQIDSLNLGYNCKILGCRNKTLEVIITDLGSSIFHFVQEFKKRFGKI